MPDDATEQLRSRVWQVRIDISEHGDRTRARAVLHGDAPTRLEAGGESRRGRVDVPVPEIGDEVAAARARRALADLLLQTAAGDIERVTGEHDVSLRSV